MSGLLRKTTVRGLGHLGLAAALAAFAVPVFGQTAPVTYPPSRSLSDIAAWLQRDTPLVPSQVVDISPQAVTAVTSASPMGETRGFLANISSEAVDPEMWPTTASHPGRSCGDRLQARRAAETMTGYKTRDLRRPAGVRATDTAGRPRSPSLLGLGDWRCDRDSAAR